eukprot:TRINITY_DN1708_c0_g1_i1.p1 TRINITY_DN1708_c0_g1~~TRINITY_DN1708_c0_g1_i1.p1  ORF type:complete len:366 (-),score=69.87 TRINITY_DN1708_c0_g1_i1:39-1136(-)
MESQDNSKTTESSSTKLLLVDGLNYSHRFFLGFNRKWMTPLEAESKAQRMIKAAKASGWRLEVFIDLDYGTEEAANKWIKRRETEVTMQRRIIPQGTNVLLGEIFARNGVPVHYSLIDNDDTIASFAQHYGGTILSADRDMFRYEGANYEVYADWEIVNGEFRLIEHDSATHKSGPRRPIITPPPKTASSYRLSFEDPKTDRYLRGTPSALTKRFGNAHLLLRPLRQASYARFGREYMIEIFPIWDEKERTVKWTNDRVEADPELDCVLDDPKLAIEMFLGKVPKMEGINKELLWNHNYAIRQMVCEIVSYSGYGKSCFDLMMDDPRWTKNERNKYDNYNRNKKNTMNNNNNKSNYKNQKKSFKH